ncbi:hypothetical protein N5B55_00105 [Ralstonia pickettii]|uniref:hypothetical protein n=1 Tax=Ralstonia pickettii TaxID=329 RepID=UPI002714C226|nr:hypothetical protein [Ralstonia pickettii]WKZ85394.1 hypothetical protein N5B55_00105 [Ralstonia pickettii]
MPIQNASGNGIDLVYVDKETKTVYHVEVKSNLDGLPGNTPQGNLPKQFADWIQDAADGKLNKQAVSSDAQALAQQIQGYMNPASGYTISHNVMQVQIPRRGSTGQVSASLRPWPPSN